MVDFNFYTKQGWMTTKLHLKGNECDIFAIVFGFCQNGCEYYGSRKYIAEWTNLSIRSVQKILNQLVDKKLLKKITINGNFTVYSLGQKARKYATNQGRGEKNSPQGCKKFTGGVKKVHRRGEKSSPHDIYRDNKKININNTADATKQSSSKHINTSKKELEVINPPFTKAEYNQFIKQNQYNKIIDSDFLYESIVKSGYKQKNKMLITKDNWKSYIGFWVKKEIIDREKIKKTLAEQDDGEFDKKAMLQMLERRRKKEQEKKDKKG